MQAPSPNDSVENETDNSERSIIAALQEKPTTTSNKRGSGKRALTYTIPKKKPSTSPSKKKTATTTKKKTSAPAAEEPASPAAPAIITSISDTLNFDTSNYANVLFKPNPGPQTSFLAANEMEVLYGGSAGGGKSYAMISDPVRYLTHPQFSGLLLRHTTEELRELIWKTQELYPRIIPGIKWSERKMQWETPQGGRLWMSYLDSDQDVLRYQGLAFSWVGFDELTQWGTPFAWNYMRSRIRTTAPDLPVFMRATTNPGGRGHQWVKKMFIDPAPPGQAFWATDIESGEVLRYPANHAKAGQPLFKRRFIPASLKDNPYLYESGTYEANLLSLPEHQRRQLLEGDWDVAEGAAFSEFNRYVHVVEPYDIPHDWARFRACDYGYGSHSCVLWFAVAPDDSLIVYRELYVSGVLAEDLGTMVMQAEQGERIRYGVLDSSCWHKRGDTGPSIAERMNAKGCRWRPSDRSPGSRVSGKNEVHRRLQIDPSTQRPRIVFFNNCRQIIADLPSLPVDKKNPEDIDTNVNNDHSYDALRYGVMSRPRSASIFDFDPSKQPIYTPMDSTFGY